LVKLGYNPILVDPFVNELNFSENQLRYEIVADLYNKLHERFEKND